MVKITQRGDTGKGGGISAAPEGGDGGKVGVIPYRERWEVE